MSKSIIGTLSQKKNQILTLWMRNQLSDGGLRDDLMNNEDLRQQSAELLDCLFDTVTDDTLTAPDAPSLAPLIDQLTHVSMSRARQGFTPRETGTYIFSLKDALLEIFRHERKEDSEQLLGEILLISKFIDSLGIVTFETFIQGREEVIMRQTDEMTEISTPVVQIWDGILAMPLIGTLDSSRALVVMENLLQEIVRTGSGIAILDISGVPTVDSMVAQHLIKTVNATRLMGAECIISGIRPEIAQTIVHLGIDLSQVVTKSTLASALKHAFASMRIEVSKANSRSF
ncbi:STAS domain-containing protein [Spirosoma utsteinense]|uniref:RsbT co-antagonist protein RsbR n=1 Tax=Spirosoma utsteinense TaxID=2585773 RepID=A0ABR6W9G3_9BACT|nr:STAS domain-containing protein [Spirosoma utsteinense]MBC3787620.1 rsbT co-antagonist protein RsbR [Spirosoma utsteinense]MBC3793216.1 rsbT co-antagonist protein RsbR [Spirosoma utsteinense]